MHQSPQSVSQSVSSVLGRCACMYKTSKDSSLAVFCFTAWVVDINLKIYFAVRPRIRRFCFLGTRQGKLCKKVWHWNKLLHVKNRFFFCLDICRAQAAGAAERARVLEEFWNRKRAAHRNKARGQVKQIPFSYWTISVRLKRPPEAPFQMVFLHYCGDAIRWRF